MPEILNHPLKVLTNAVKVKKTADIVSYRRVYYEAHKDIIRKKIDEIHNTIVTCPSCNKQLKYMSISKHRKSKAHISKLTESST